MCENPAGPTETMALEELLYTLAGQVVLQQERLDAAYLRSLEEFREFYAWAIQNGLEAQARQVEPRPSVVGQTDFEVAVATERSSFSELRVLNTVLARRFSDRFVRQRLEFTVRRAPLAPGQEIPAKAV